MLNAIVSLGASLLPRRLKGWGSTPSQFLMNRSRPIGNVGHYAYLDKPTPEAHTQALAELWPQIQERSFKPHILNFHPGISRILRAPEAVNSPVYTSVEDTGQASADSSPPTFVVEPDAPELHAEEFLREDSEATEPGAVYHQKATKAPNTSYGSLSQTGPESMSQDVEISVPDANSPSGCSDEALFKLIYPDDNFLGAQFLKSKELHLTFGGKFGRQLRWENQKASVDSFIHCCAKDKTHSLTVILEPSQTNDDAWERRRTLEHLFDRLKKPLTTRLDGSGALSLFSRISITVPDEHEYVNIMSPSLLWNNPSPAWNVQDTDWGKINIRSASNLREDEREGVNIMSLPLPRVGNNAFGWNVQNAEQDKIDISSASNLREFLWNGPFQQLSKNFLYPAAGLTLLSVTGCVISLEDAIELLRPCSSLETIELRTVHGDPDALERLTLKSGSKFKFVLKELSITSSVDLTPILALIAWVQKPELILSFSDNGSQDANALSCASASFLPQNAVLKFKGNFSQQTVDTLKGSGWIVNQD
ncbi:hypothetical protein M413DRAFT_29406 [Hebeloma cylindrosporum]|uniref:Uncharacterized protein n=1 Tax=Hebeloma cylindrosporum TaxID=76867 RepID=A0A0C2YDY3_HEBCY|nr:hypothetical protein M413DRAFT_29406 [Hebeloma cylindrosporum h7]